MGTIKLFLLSTGERVISRAQEVLESENSKRVVGYLLEQPHVVTYDDALVEESDGLSLNITMSPWQILSKESKIPITPNLVWSVITPLDSVVDMYVNRVFPESAVEVIEESGDE